MQRRQVVCQDEFGLSDRCDQTTRPTEVQACNTGACPAWNTGVWSEVITKQIIIPYGLLKFYLRVYCIGSFTYQIY